MFVIDMLKETKVIPTFNSSVLLRGHFMVSCANETTKNWLVGKVTQWVSCPEVMLNVVRQDDVPKLVRLSTYIPKSSTNSSELVLKRLRLQILTLIADE